MPIKQQSIYRYSIVRGNQLSGNSFDNKQYAYNKNIAILHYELPTWKNKMFSYYVLQRTEFGSEGLGVLTYILH